VHPPTHTRTLLNLLLLQNTQQHPKTKKQSQKPNNPINKGSTTTNLSHPKQNPKATSKKERKGGRTQQNKKQKQKTNPTRRETDGEQNQLNLV
jgi:hypothetical protein